MRNMAGSFSPPEWDLFYKKCYERVSTLIVESYPALSSIEHTDFDGNLRLVGGSNKWK